MTQILKLTGSYEVKLLQLALLRCKERESVMTTVTLGNLKNKFKVYIVFWVLLLLNI